MKRWPRMMLVVAMIGGWLVIGATITVAVAWGGVEQYDRYIGRSSQPVIFGGHFTVPSREWHEPLTSWEVVVPQSWPPPVCGEVREQALWTLSSFSDGADIQFAAHWAAWHSFGWPCRALRFEWWTDRPGAAVWERQYDWAILSPATQHHVNTSPLPVRPLWPGFALNTLLYAALACGLWQLPSLLRRRNRCTRCGYSLAGLAAGETGHICPECGPAAGTP